MCENKGKHFNFTFQIYFFSIVVSNIAAKWCHEHVPSQSKLRGEQYSKAEALLGRKETFSFLSPLPKPLEFMESALSVSPRGSYSFAIWQAISSLFNSVSSAVVAQRGAFQNPTVVFAGDYLGQDIGVAVDSLKHLLGLTQVEPNLPPGKAGLEVLPILFLHFFKNLFNCLVFSLFFCLSSALIVIICP